MDQVARHLVLPAFLKSLNDRGVDSKNIVFLSHSRKWVKISELSSLEDKDLIFFLCDFVTRGVDIKKIHEVSFVFGKENAYQVHLQIKLEGEDLQKYTDFCKWCFAISQNKTILEKIVA